MELSTVVTTLNGREQLVSCLDALAEHVPAAEVIVVNGPSVDGTTGYVREREDVDVLVEIDERNINSARNAGIRRARGDVLALLTYDHAVESGWVDAVADGLERDDAVTGPTHRQLETGIGTEYSEVRTIAGREIQYFNGGNVAFHRTAIEAIDGFDELLETGGARDAAHRLAALDYDVAWNADMSVRRERSVGADGGQERRDWYERYRSLCYRLTKNYGAHPTVGYRILRHAVDDAGSTLADVARGKDRTTAWFGNGRDVLRGLARGTRDGFGARWRDRTRRRNPSGLSTRADRAVAVYDRRI